MRYGIIDMGSNSFRLSVYEEKGGKPRQIMRQKIMAGLAGYVKDGCLTQAGMDRACAALAELLELLYSFRPEKTGVFATASLRNIDNTEEALDRIEQSCGIRPEVLSGREEARLDFLGASSFFPKERGLIADVGGGSTELVWFDRDGPREMLSLPIGSLFLSSRYVEGMLPAQKEREEMSKAADAALDSVPWPVREGDIPMVCGIGGTMRMALQLRRELLGRPGKEPVFTAKDLEDIGEIAFSQKPEVRKKAYRLVPDRMFSMEPGLILISAISRRFLCQEFFVSEAGVREGYLFDRMRNENFCQMAK